MGDEGDHKDDEEEYDEEGSKEADDDEYYDEEYDEEYDKHNVGGHEPIGHHTTLEEAKHWWKKLSPGARKKIAEEEYIKNEEDKRFQIYLKALILEAEKIG